jgi:hypothetical protein
VAEAADQAVQVRVVVHDQVTGAAEGQFPARVEHLLVPAEVDDESAPARGAPVALVHLHIISYSFDQHQRDRCRIGPRGRAEAGWTA